MPDSPASRSKLLAGDVIVKVNGVDTTKVTLPNFQKMLAGGRRDEASPDRAASEQRNRRKTLTW